MANIPDRYNAAGSEKKWQQFWEDRYLYQFDTGKDSPVFSIDTPPPTVSGNLHLGHCYSYSQPDFYARFHRMNGENVFYPMGFDDNGLPTERLVEKRLGITPENTGIETYIREIQRISEQLETDYEQLWRRLGLSIDWNYLYKTVSPESHKAAQYSFLELYRKGLIYRSSSPAIWCPTCKTAIAHAEVTDLQRQADFITIPFKLDNNMTIPIATTRPELLPACVAVFVNPEDKRYRNLVGRKAAVPLFDRLVPVLADEKADPEKGTGIVMCCTFGDTTDIKWWREYNLPLISIIGTDGLLNNQAGFLAGLDIKSAHKKVIEELKSRHLVLDEKVISQTVSIHERCDTPVEYMETMQWFIRILAQKEELLEAGRKITWHPDYMLSRYEDWVKNLEWDWCISRQRYHGIPFPLWYCAECDEVLPVDISDLPVDPRIHQPLKKCSCGSSKFIPETSVMDTWMTSSLTPQIAGKWLESTETFSKVFPMSLRPQAHDIIRTWAFYTIVKSIYHFNEIPWKDIAISGHGLSQEGHKVSKSKSSNIADPSKMMDKYSADAVRYWAASSKFGEDSLINEEKIAAGQKLVNKLWSITRFSFPFLENYTPSASIPYLVPTDKWVLSELQHLITDVSDAYKTFDHLSAKNRIENFLWNTLADNYLEMVKSRLYDRTGGAKGEESAKYTLYRILLSLTKLLAPLMPYITEEIYQLIFRRHEEKSSIHLADWPVSSRELLDESADITGKALLEIASSVRRYKSENHLPMSSPLEHMRYVVSSKELLDELTNCLFDIRSVTRVNNIEIVQSSRQISKETSIYVE
jgi:valyl-tRNA synthetase